jgi:hypothetical protein
VLSGNCLSLDNHTSPWKHTIVVGGHQVTKLVLADISVGAKGGAGAKSFAVHIPDHSPSIHATLEPVTPKQENTIFVSFSTLTIYTA